MATSVCSYNDRWPKEFFWVGPDPNNRHAAICTLCNSKIYLSNMGRGAITSHRKGAIHQRREKRACMSAQLTDFSVMKKTDSCEEKNSETKIDSALASTNNPNVQVEGTSSSSTAAGEPEFSKKTAPTGIKKFLLKEDITKAEILWCLQIVATHKSLRSAEKDARMFSHIFSDSDIAKGMQLCRDKMMYNIVFGIALFFKEELLKDILLCDHFVVGFDESLNKISQKQQMDVNIRYWCTKENIVKTRYLNSAFLGRSCATDLLEKSVDWKIFDFMCALYYIFKDSPARRALYALHTNSHEFPKKFCSIRWLENSQVAERCLSILPNVKLFIDKVEKDKNAPSSQSYRLVKNLINDPLLPAKLAFFHSVATEFESFLREYQTDIPLIPFLFEDLSNLMLRMMRRF